MPTPNTGKSLTTSSSNDEGQSINILDRPLPGFPQQVSLSALSFLFAETIQYFQERIENVRELERLLVELGHSAGSHMLDLMVIRKRPGQRDLKIVTALQFVSTTCWKSLFGRAADALERSTKSEAEYHIHDTEPITNHFVSVPRGMGNLNCAAFVAGIIQGLLCTAGFTCAVSSHFVGQPAAGAPPQQKTVYLIKFTPEVMAREAGL